MTDGGLIKICLLSYLKDLFFWLVSMKWQISCGGGVGVETQPIGEIHRPRRRMSETQVVLPLSRDGGM